MGEYHDKRFPGESDDYRNSRDELLKAEIELRRQIEEVARMRRGLPPGGRVKEDYIFEEGGTELEDRQTVQPVKLSNLFRDGKSTLLIYSFMFAPDAEKPCPSCTSILDGLNGQARHFLDRISFVAVAKAPIQRFRDWARQRGWDNLRLLSSYHNSYNGDYFGESEEGGQLPALNVFVKTGDGIRHFYNTELLYAPSEEGQNARHVDLIWPLWNLLDYTPEGRGTDWYPRHRYNTSTM